MEQIKETKRVLLGWPGLDSAALLAGAMLDKITSEHRAKVQSALTAVQNRPAFQVQTEVITETGTELSEYLLEFWAQNPNLVKEGWTVKIANLKSVCTIQPAVEVVNSKDRTSGVSANNFLEIAKISIPKANPTPMAVSYDQSKNAFVFSSPNPNLKILSPVNTPDGIFGFLAGIANSFVQVVKCNDRYFMRDGHHRGYGFLSNNIHKIPVLYREFNSINEMGLPVGLFPIETLIGNKPPTLMDYFDETVSGLAEFIRPTKVVMIQGLEISTVQ
jgi:hypothetical protein